MARRDSSEFQSRVILGNSNHLSVWQTSLRPNHELPSHSGLPASVESIGSDLYPIPSLSTKYSNSAGTSKPHQNWVSRILVSGNIRAFFRKHFPDSKTLRYKNSTDYTRRAVDKSTAPLTGGETIQLLVQLRVTNPAESPLARSLFTAG